MHGWSGSLINVPYGAYLDHCYAWNLQTHFLRVFVANLKNDAIYGFYPESFCDKNLAIRKVFAFSDSGLDIVPTMQFYMYLCLHLTAPDLVELWVAFVSTWQYRQCFVLPGCSSAPWHWFLSTYLGPWPSLCWVEQQKDVSLDLCWILSLIP